MAKKTILILFFVFVLNRSVAIESAALKAEIITCYGIFESFINNKIIIKSNSNIKVIFNELKLYVDNQLREHFNVTEYYNIGTKKGLYAIKEYEKNKALLNSLLLGCSQTIKNLK